jgi:hypothetical protein
MTPAHTRNPEWTVTPTEGGYWFRPQTPTATKWYARHLRDQYPIGDGGVLVPESQAMSVMFDMIVNGFLVDYPELPVT